MDIDIREIRPDDYPRVAALWQDEIGNRRATVESLTIFYDKVRDDPRYRTWVAVHAGDAVGFITMTQSCEIGREVGFIHICGLAVRAELQNRGIGKRLLGHLETYARNMGVSSILLNSGFQRHGAHAFYERSGYDRGSYCFSKAISNA